MKNFDQIGPVRLACGMNLTAAIMLSIPALISGNLYITIASSFDLSTVVFGLGVISATAYTIFIIRSVRQVLFPLVRLDIW
jgi:hypothetical protein